MLRQSVQSLDATLNDIAQADPRIHKSEGRRAEIRENSSSFTLLTQAEQRAEMLRRQLLELLKRTLSIAPHHANRRRHAARERRNGR